MQVFLTDAMERLLRSYMQTEFLNISDDVSYVSRRYPDKNVAIKSFLKNIFILFCYIYIFMLIIDFLRVS